MTRDRARKRAIRARMAATGEPYNLAARNLGARNLAASSLGESSLGESSLGESSLGESSLGESSLGASGPPGAAQDAVGDVIACATRTLAASSARIEDRSDTELPRGQQWKGRRRPGLIGRLARRAARGALERVAPGTDLADLREMFLHQVGEGFVEPAAGRYLIDYGGYAQVLIDGRRFSGLSGEPLGPRYESRGKRRQDDPLELLRLVQGVTDARDAGAETVRGTPCRQVAAAAGSVQFTVWIDDEHVRRIQTVERASGASSGSATTFPASPPTTSPASAPTASAPTTSAPTTSAPTTSAPTTSATSTVSSVSRTETLELWDFGVAVDSLDWSRLPSFRTVR